MSRSRQTVCTFWPANTGSREELLWNLRKGLARVTSGAKSCPTLVDSLARIPLNLRSRKTDAMDGLVNEHYSSQFQDKKDRLCDEEGIAIVMFMYTAEWKEAKSRRFEADRDCAATLTVLSPRTNDCNDILIYLHLQHVGEKGDDKYTMAFSQHPNPRMSVLSTTSISSGEYMSPASSSTRFSLPSTTPISVQIAAKMGNRPNIYDRNLNRTRTAEVSLSAYAFLFS